jgi:hypothetical protein
LCYVPVVKLSELKRRSGWEADFVLIVATVLFCGFSAASRAAEATAYAPILYPSIFWHDNQWETYENGQWVPYRGSANNNSVEAEPEEAIIPEEPQTPDMVDTNIYYPAYGWGFIGAPAFNHPHRHHARTHVRPDHRRMETGVGQQNVGLGQPNAGLGQTTIGIRKPNAGIGKSTVGIGRANAGIGQPTIGIGQPNVGIGQPNAGIGRTTVGIGQPNAGVGQPNATVGQPNVGIGSTTIGIGQPMTGRPR